MPTGYEHLSDEELGAEIARAGGDGPFVPLAEFPEFTAEDAESWGAGCEERSADEFELEIALRAESQRHASEGAQVGESCRKAATGDCKPRLRCGTRAWRTVGSGSGIRDW